MAAEAPPKLVVRAYAPARGWPLRIAVVLLAVFALYLAYEFGRYDAGYDRLAVGQRETGLEVTVERLTKENRELRVELAGFDTFRKGQERQREEVSKTIGDLQAQVARQAQDLAFYRGIVAQGSSTIEVKIQQLRIGPGDEPGRYRLQLTLVQPVRPENVVSGTVVLRVEGRRDGGAAALDAAELPFKFRYFENIDPEVTIPDGFTPERVAIEVRSSRTGVAPVLRTFPWSLES